MSTKHVCSEIGLNLSNQQGIYCYSMHLCLHSSVHPYMLYP